MIDVVFHVFLLACPSIDSSRSMRPILVTRVLKKIRRSRIGRGPRRRRRDGCTRCREDLLIGSPTNGSASCGRVVFPNLGYKKDAFLEPSLVSNNFPLSPNNPTNNHSYPQHQQLRAMANPNNQQPSSLSSRAPDFIPAGNLSGPGVAGGPAPVDSIGRSGVALMQGGQMCAMFILSV